MFGHAAAQRRNLGAALYLSLIHISSRILEEDVVGKEHYEVANKVQQMLQKYKELQDIIAILGMEEPVSYTHLDVYKRQHSSSICCR